MSDPLEVRYIGVNVGGAAGVPDGVAYVRIVPAGRNGTVVLARTLAPNENDTGEPVVLRPDQGDRLQFAPGAIAIRFADVDRRAKRDQNGYAGVSGTLWTWLGLISAQTDPAVLRYLLAACRRLDTSYELYTSVEHRLASETETFEQARDRVFAALGLAELMCVAIGRAIDMLESVDEHFGIKYAVPTSVTRNKPALRDIRNAFEHIEDRALGRVRGKPHADALSVFDQARLFSEGTLAYGRHALNLQRDVLPLLLDARATFLDIAKMVTQPLLMNTSSIVFFEGPPSSNASQLANDR